MSSLIDAHCHLTDSSLNNSARSDVFLRSEKVGIRRFILGGISPEEWQRQYELANRYPGQVFTAYGLHPWWIDEAHRMGKPERIDDGLQKLRDELTGSAPPVALGETGLDSGPRVLKESFDLQLRSFKAHLELAREFGRPLVLHIVKAHEPALQALQELGGTQNFRGMVHSFSGNAAIAQRYRELGFLISVGAGITRNGFESLKKAVVRLPAEALVIESDSPDQLPEPASIWEVARAIAELRKASNPEAESRRILEQSRDNLEREFLV